MAVTDASAPTTTDGARVSPRRLTIAAATAVVAGVAVLGAASALDTSPERTAIQRAPFQVGPSAAQGAGGMPGAGMPGAGMPGAGGPAQPSGGEASLPPLTVILDRPAPGGIGELPAAQQIVRLRDLTAGQPNARRFVEMGRAQLELGDAASADASFRAALAQSPGDPAALIGRAFVDHLSGPAGPGRAKAAMARLARTHPRSQLVAFNQGWLAVYRRDRDGLVTAWRRTVTLGPDTPLGLTAAEFLKRATRR